MGTHSVDLLASRSRILQTATIILNGVVGTVMLCWLVFCALLSSWSLWNSANLSAALWYGATTVFLVGAAFYLTKKLLELPSSVDFGSVQGARRDGGSPPGSLPLAGAPCPVPIRPTPHLVRCPAERLLLENKKSVDAIYR